MQSRDHGIKESPFIISKRCNDDWGHVFRAVIFDSPPPLLTISRNTCFSASRCWTRPEYVVHSDTKCHLSLQTLLRLCRVASQWGKRSSEQLFLLKPTYPTPQFIRPSEESESVGIAWMVGWSCGCWSVLLLWSMCVAVAITMTERVPDSCPILRIVRELDNGRKGSKRTGSGYRC